MNVYDFDGTLYDGDSSVDFFKFVVKHEPVVIKKLPLIVKGGIKYFTKTIDKRALKENFFSFLSLIDGARYVDLFWSRHKDRIFKWYLSQQQENDVIISASPEFLLAPICKELGVKHLIASKVDIYTGKFLSPNCKGEEKVRLFEERFPNGHIECFYSDSKSDLPLAYQADEAFLIQNGHITEWKIDDGKNVPKEDSFFELVIRSIQK